MNAETLDWFEGDPQLMDGMALATTLWWLLFCFLTVMGAG